MPPAETDPTVRAVTNAELFLDRYGVLTRGSVATEDVPGGFAAVYRVLSAAEEAGKVRRGYFVEGLGASQFASTGAVDRLRSMAPGPVNVRLPKVLRVPEGHIYTWTENPLGINGYYLVSRGDKVPWRLKLRSASFGNVQTLSHLLPGCLVGDMVAVLGSMFFVVGDIDK